ncbi:hypothetical protein ACMXYX_17725 (plasmid) [Neptuniibacter sp. QD72_48]|uniref:hypothetical protein n=1 Tax=Neptuniibacter sp. QD72_48 TaxID=3398214 RepID=UPI0039F5FE39
MKRIILTTTLLSASISAQAGFLKTPEEINPPKPEPKVEQKVIRTLEVPPEAQVMDLKLKPQKEEQPKEAQEQVAKVEQPKPQSAPVKANAALERQFDAWEKEALFAISKSRLKNSRKSTPALTLYGKMRDSGLHPERTKAIYTQIAEQYLKLANGKLYRIEQSGYAATSQNQKDLDRTYAYLMTVEEELNDKDGIIFPLGMTTPTAERYFKVKERLTNNQQVAAAKPQPKPEKKIIRTEKQPDGSTKSTFSLKGLFGG